MATQLIPSGGKLKKGQRHLPNGMKCDPHTNASLTLLVLSMMMCVACSVHPASGGPQALLLPTASIKSLKLSFLPPSTTTLLQIFSSIVL